jgi:hypothetical protein
VLGVPLAVAAVGVDAAGVRRVDEAGLEGDEVAVGAGEVPRHPPDGPVAAFRGGDGGLLEVVDREHHRERSVLVLDGGDLGDVELVDVGAGDGPGGVTLGVGDEREGVLACEADLSAALVGERAVGDGQADREVAAGRVGVVGGGAARGGIVAEGPLVGEGVAVGVGGPGGVEAHGEPVAGVGPARGGRAVALGAGDPLDDELGVDRLVAVRFGDLDQARAVVGVLADDDGRRILAGGAGVVEDLDAHREGAGRRVGDLDGVAGAVVEGAVVVGVPGVLVGGLAAGRVGGEGDETLGFDGVGSAEVDRERVVEAAGGLDGVGRSGAAGLEDVLPGPAECAEGVDVPVAVAVVPAEVVGTGALPLVPHVLGDAVGLVLGGVDDGIHDRVGAGVVAVVVVGGAVGEHQVLAAGLVGDVAPGFDERGCDAGDVRGRHAGPAERGDGAGGEAGGRDLGAGRGDLGLAEPVLEVAGVGGAAGDWTARAAGADLVVAAIDRLAVVGVGDRDRALGVGGAGDGLLAVGRRAAGRSLRAAVAGGDGDGHALLVEALDRLAGAAGVALGGAQRAEAQRGDVDPVVGVGERAQRVALAQRVVPPLDELEPAQGAADRGAAGGDADVHETGAGRGARQAGPVGLGGLAEHGAGDVRPVAVVVGRVRAVAGIAGPVAGRAGRGDVGAGDEARVGEGAVLVLDARVEDGDHGVGAIVAEGLGRLAGVRAARAGGLLRLRGGGADVEDGLDRVVVLDRDDARGLSELGDLGGGDLSLDGRDDLEGVRLAGAVLGDEPVEIVVVGPVVVGDEHTDGSPAPVLVDQRLGLGFGPVVDEVGVVVVVVEPSVDPVDRVVHAARVSRRGGREGGHAGQRSGDHGDRQEQRDEGRFGELGSWSEQARGRSRSTAHVGPSQARVTSLAIRDEPRAS